MSGDRRFFGRAWRSLGSTCNVFGKLALLALLQCVPVVGQMITLGYFLGWVRQAAWGCETPLPAHVCGRGDADFWPRGATAWCVQALYGLLICAVDAVVLLVLGGVLCLDLSRLAESVCVGVASALIVFADVLLVMCMYVGLVRLALYNSFGAAWQMGACLKMAFHDFGGLLKVAFGGLGLQLLVGLGSCVAVGALVLVGVLASGTAGMDFGIFAGGAAAPALVSLAGAWLAALPLLFVASYLLAIPYILVAALTWRALGNWAAQFDVAHWGTRHDPMPFEPGAGVRGAATSPAQASSPAVASVGAPVSESEQAAACAPVPAAADATADAPGSGNASAPVEGASEGATASPEAPGASGEPVSAPKAAEVSAQAGAHEDDVAVSFASGSPQAPRRRSHPVLVCVLCLLGSALALACAGFVAAVGASGALCLYQGVASYAPLGQDAGGLEGSWRTSDGQVVTLKSDRTFTWRYADGSEVKGTYVAGEVTDRFDDDAAQALRALSELGLDVSASDFAGARSFEVVLTASAGTDGTGSGMSSRVRGNTVDALFVVRGSSAQVYDLAAGSGQDVSATRQ